jgi:hypothetical protein
VGGVGGTEITASDNCKYPYSACNSKYSAGFGHCLFCFATVSAVCIDMSVSLPDAHCAYIRGFTIEGKYV